MANISLRAYEKLIDELIEQNNLQEAIAHCKHILKSYPKCISIYRILGKAFLEEKAYIETADVFKRVLTVYPDDFISHVGMSLVRENENNIDAAIWHMELAFDSQPSNITIQEELKRLFGRRDGTHPTKIRLTRGALVRMYARGELYQQAIAEINSALSETAKRMDLEVFLAKMYYLSGDQKSAIDLCQNLEKEVPYCYEVNKILFETSPNSNHADKNNPYAVRLAELNPYEEFINARFPTVEDVPDDKVMIDELTDLPTAPTSKENTWVSSLNDEWDKPSFIPEPAITAVSDQESSSIPLKKEPAQVPENLFEESDSSAFSESLVNISRENPATNTDVTKSNDWLSELSASSAIDQPEATRLDEKAPAEVPEWLRSLVPEESESGSPTTSQSLASPFDEITPEENSEPETPVIPSSSPFDSQSHPSTSSDQNSTDSDLPDWLKNFDVEKVSEPVSQDDLPDWLNTLDAKPKTDESITQAFSIEEPASPNQPFNVGAFAIDESDNTSKPSFEENKPSDAFRSDEVVNNPLVMTEEPEQRSGTERPEKEIPEWIRMLHGSEEKDLSASNGDEGTPEENIFEPAQPKVEAEENLADEDLKPDQAISEKTSDDLLDWLRELKPEDNQSALPQTDNLQESKGNTDGLSYDFDAELNKLSGIEPQEATDQQNVEPVSVPVDDTDDFLKSLSGIQDVSETKPEQQEDIIPLSEESSPDYLEQFEKSTNLSSVVAEPGTSLEPQTKESKQASEPIEEKSLSSEHTPSISMDDLMASIESNPEDHRSWRLLGDAYAEQGKYSDALFAYNKAEQILLKSK
jgi:tetratricopeptide (TPR) repeat protein